MLYDRKTGEKKNLTEDFDQWVGTFIWAPDSKTIYFSSEHRGHSLIYHAWDTSKSLVLCTTTTYHRSGYQRRLAVSRRTGRSCCSRACRITAPTEIYAA